MICVVVLLFFFFSSRRRHTRCSRDWSSDVCSSDLEWPGAALQRPQFSSGAEESARLSALRSYCVLETGREARFDDLTGLASTICETPVSLVSLVDTNRLFFKSAHGIDLREVPYPDFFCGHAIRQSDLFVVPDATGDP